MNIAIQVTYLVVINFDYFSDLGHLLVKEQYKKFSLFKIVTTVNESRMV